MPKHSLVTADLWHQLRSATSARIALGRAGGSLPTHEWLKFKAAHAAARDAVHLEFHAEELARQIGTLGVEAVVVESAARDRLVYLQRPDLGRRLDEDSRKRLHELGTAIATPALAIITTDGLSAIAVHRQVPSLLATLLPLFREDGLQLAPIVIARFGRVALEDEIGQLLRAELALMLIGERPGLGSPDSLSAYLVYAPQIGNTDANRNCVSNIRPEGLPLDTAAETIRYLVAAARGRRLSGIGLKDERGLASPNAAGALADQR